MGLLEKAKKYREQILEERLRNLEKFYAGRVLSEDELLSIKKFFEEKLMKEVFYLNYKVSLFISIIRIINKLPTISGIESIQTEIDLMLRSVIGVKEYIAVKFVGDGSNIIFFFGDSKLLEKAGTMFSNLKENLESADYVRRERDYVFKIYGFGKGRNNKVLGLLLLSDMEKELTEDEILIINSLCKLVGFLEDTIGK